MKKALHRILIAAIGFVIIYNYSWHDAPYKSLDNTIRSDGTGYYAWLPAMFIYHDLSFSFFSKEENKGLEGRFHPRFLQPHATGQVLKTGAGVSLMLSPFFLSVYGARSVLGYSSTGYEGSFQRMVSIAALFYLLLGLYFFEKIALLKGASYITVVMTSWVMLLGTNLGFYALLHPSMSHVYSFFLIAVFLWCMLRFTATKSKRYLFLSAILLGLIYLVRPVNLMVLGALPLLFPSWRTFLNWLLELVVAYKKVAVAFLLFCAVVGIQFLLSYLQTGDWLVWSYKGEGFHFAQPQIWNALFSFNHGLFMYTPVLFAIIIFLVIQAFKKSYQSTVTLSFFVVISFIISSWWCWNYGGGYSGRAFTEFYSILFLPIALLRLSKPWHMRMFALSCIPFIALNIVQTYQFSHGIIHPEWMTKEYYAYVFLKTEDRFSNCLGGAHEIPLSKLHEVPFFHSNLNETEGFKLETTKATINTSFKLDAAQLFGGKLQLSSPVMPVAQPTYIQVQLDRMELEKDACKNAVLVFAMEDENGMAYDYMTVRINDIPQDEINQWRTMHFHLRLVELRKATDRFTFYIYNPEGKQSVIKNLSVSLFNYE